MATQPVDELLRENRALRTRLDEAEDAIRALQAGEADAVLVEGERDQVYTLETADKPYRLLVEQMPHAAATLTCEGEIIYCNKRFAEEVGRPLATLLGRPLSDLVSPESRETLESLLHKGTSAEVQGEVTLVRGDGSLMTSYFGVGLLTEGAFGSCLVVSDLTEQRHYQELKRTQEALHASEERLELAQRIGGVGTFEWNIQTGEATWSATQEELYGLPGGSFDGRFESWQAAVHPADRARTMTAVKKAVAERTELDMEFRIVRPDGQTRWIASRGKVFYDTNGTPLRLLGISQDVTDRRAAIAEREHLLDQERAARAAAEQAVQARDEVLGFVAHDLRNPLLSIAMSVESLLRDPERARQQQAVEVIQRSVQDMQRLIGDLLDVERLESSGLAIDRGRVELEPLLQEACREFAPRARAANLSLHCQVDGPVPAASADRDRLARVLANLLTNAMKFTPPRGSVLLGARARDGEVEVAVSDTGQGIAPEQLPRVFDRFWQADRSAGKGAGLGLAICKGIVEAHGGRIWIESTVGVGTTVRFTLPRA